MNDETPETPDSHEVPDFDSLFNSAFAGAGLNGASTPTEPTALMREAANELFAAYTAFTQAGFAAGQALYLVGQMLTSSGGSR